MGRQHHASMKADADSLLTSERVRSTATVDFCMLKDFYNIAGAY